MCGTKADSQDDSVPFRIVQSVLAMLLACVYPGLLEGTRFHGRSNPLLGPGVPPPDDFDPPSTREHHKGWHPLHSHLLQKRFACCHHQYAMILLQHYTCIHVLLHAW